MKPENIRPPGVVYWPHEQPASVPIATAPTLNASWPAFPIQSASRPIQDAHAPMAPRQPRPPLAHGMQAAGHWLWSEPTMPWPPAQVPPPLMRQPLPPITAVSQPEGYEHLIERPTPPGQEKNAAVIRRFNRGKATANDVLSITTACLNGLFDDWNSAMACLQALSRCSHASTGEHVDPDCIAYNAAITTCEKAGRADKALALFHHMLIHGPANDVFPDTVTYSSAIAACEKGSRPDAAMWLFQHLLVHGPARDVFPNEITYGSIIPACGKAGWIDEAVWLFQHLLAYGPAHDVFPNTVAYNTLMAATESKGLGREAMVVFDHLKLHGPNFEAWPDAISYSLAISACEQIGRTDMHPDLLRHAKHAGCFQASLGFDPVANLLDFHQDAVLTRRTHVSDRSPGVHSAVARAIFNCLFSDPEAVLGKGARGIDESTRFVVGQGDGTLMKTIGQCMVLKGWNPVHPPGPSGRPNRGCLVAEGHSSTKLTTQAFIPRDAAHSPR